MKKVFYIKQPYAGYFKELKVGLCDFKDANLTSYIYFEREDEAEEFLKNLKKFIIGNYPRAKFFARRIFIFSFKQKILHLSKRK